MEPETVIRRMAGRLRKRAAMRMKSRRVLDSLYYGIAAAAVYMALGRFSGRAAFELWAFSMPLLISLLVGVLRAALAKPDALRLMAEADRRFALQERLSTAYELLEGGRESALKGLQIRDAASRAQALDSRSFNPGPALRWRLRHTLLTAAFITAAVLPRGLASNRPLPGAPAHLKEQGTALERLERHVERRPPIETTPLPGAAGHQVVQPGQSLRKGDAGAPQTGMGDEADALQSVEGEFPTIWQEGGGLPEFQKLSDDELRKLTEGLIEKRPPLLTPVEIEQLREALKSGHTTALGKLLKRLTARREEAARRPDRGLEGGGKTADDRAPYRPHAGRGELSGTKSEPGTGAISGPAWGQEAMFWEAEGEGGFSTSSLPGEGRGSERGVASPPPRGGTTGGTRVKSQMDKGEVLRGLVKALPVRNPPTVPPEEVIAQYRQRAESLMERYELPSDYREYIKRYFLAIGLGEGGEEK